jgi:cytochrome c peroxidase
MDKQKHTMRELGGASALACSLVLGFSGSVSAVLDFETETDYDLKLLGKYVFFDKISNPPRMACVSCHDPDTGGTGSVSGVNLHQVAITGANPHTVGNLKPPTNAYASLIAPFTECNTGGFGALQGYCGGNFWNSRAEGRLGDDADQIFPAGATKHIGAEVFQNDANGNSVSAEALGYERYFGPTSDQALNPMPNPVEQNIVRQAVCQHVASAKYAELYKKAWGVEIDCSDTNASISAIDVDNPPETQFDISFKRIMLAVGAWQHSGDLNSFTSNRDNALRQEVACVCDSPQSQDETNLCAEDVGKTLSLAAPLTVAELVAPYYDASVCDAENFTNSRGKFPLVGLTEQENYGHDLFYATRFSPLILPDGSQKFANCAFCHADNPVVPGPGPTDTGDELFQLYSADDFHNIGTPPNPEIPESFDANGNLTDPDLGFAGHAVDAAGDSIYPKGFHKTPTVRNVNKRKGQGFIKAYAHNGWFKSMESIVHFYNTAFVDGATAAQFGITRCLSDETEKDALANNCWPAPASGDGPSAIPFLVGDLGLTAEDEAAIVAYLATLTDTETAKAPKPYKPE